MLSRTARDLADGRAVGWFQGQFGPRALGARLILGDARSPSMQRTLNLRVKHRASFRPFAPSVLREHASDWFQIDAASPYMLMVADVVKGRRRAMSAEEQARFGIDKLNAIRSEIPAVTHVDDPARIQTVHRDTNPIYHALLVRFRDLTGCPVIVNTSFNMRGEPIVCTPEDAFRCAPGGRPSHAEQGAAGPRAPPGLQKCLGARLIGSDGNCRLAARSRQRGRRQICARASGPAPCGSQLAPALRQSRRRLLPIAPWPWPQLRCRAAAH